MSRRTSRRRAVVAALLLAGCAVLPSGCVSLPASGGVHAGPVDDQAADEAPFDYRPGGPRRGSTPVEVVSGFLQAMQATPLTTSIARQFLTSESSSGWVPEKGTVVYGGHSLRTAGSVVRLTLDHTVQLNARGEWLGDTHRGAPTTFTLKLRKEKGQWRISDPPDALIVPETHFETRFQQYFLYFFDPSAQVMVPEPVYLPRGEQAPTMLVRGLLRGPDEALQGVERTFIPAGTELGISVPIRRDGTADVPLSDEILDLSDADLNLALAQLAWTLDQVPGIERMEVTVDSTPLEVPGQGSEVSVAGWSDHDPSVNWASRELFGIRDGRVVTLDGGQERRISGLFGSESWGLRTIAVDLPAERVAGVTADGTSLVVAPRIREAGRTPSAADATTVYSGGTDLLRPSWDLHGQLWFVDRPRGRAVLAVDRGGSVTTVEAPGITGQPVTSLVVSRDGTRVVAAIDGPTEDRLVIARVLRDHEGRVRGVTRAEPLSVGSLRPSEIRDVAWRTPGTLALLTVSSQARSEVVIARVDGSSVAGEPATDAGVFSDRAVRVVTSPAPGAPLYVATSTGLMYELASTGRWTGAGIKAGLGSPTFVG